eukprot:CAMPEP_0194029476 /NCGR_PEP_ID=MMETSP0009_2-20130614/3185_1 /TAXON_ID=210454 /ORGANISM="Grammatophora oceanica, Strain CCMP 410" /LENGTH=95 /DNA_ID=CAMNT_0038669143 /DNA_START=21 /DNA_END=308 /DNA_ORIENTATION=-
MSAQYDTRPTLRKTLKRSSRRTLQGGAVVVRTIAVPLVRATIAAKRGLSGQRPKTEEAREERPDAKSLSSMYKSMNYVMKTSTRTVATDDSEVAA